VDNFSYLGDMLSVDGDADAAVKTRIHIQCNKYRQLVTFAVLNVCNSSGNIVCLSYNVFTYKLPV